jgi:CubicO group peptidase (beta-lactamase class C family)
VPLSVSLLPSLRCRFGIGLAVAISLCFCADAVQAQEESRTVTWRAHPPAAHGFDAVALAEAVERAEEIAPPLTSLLVARGDTTIAEVYFGNGGPNRGTNLKSASKSVISALAGIAIEEGAIDGLDQPIGPFFPELLANAPRKQQITVRNLLTQQAGLESTSFGNYGEWVTSRDWVANALQRPMEDRRGGEMIYSTGNTHLLGAIIAEATGQSLRAYAQDHLFDPLGVRIRSWQQSPAGRYFGGNNMSLTPRGMLRFGQLYLNDGRVDGQQVLSPDWITLSWKTYVLSTYRNHQYGYLWFTHWFGGERVAFAWGYGGQYIFVVPRLDLVVACASSLGNRPPGSTDHNTQILRLLDKHIIPAARSPGVTDAWPPLPQPIIGW